MAKKKSITTELGDTGVTNFGGRISGEEYNRDLVGIRGLRVYEQMRKSDATVKASLRAVKLPIKSANYRLDPASEEEADKQVAEFIKHNLMERIDWQKFLGEALTTLDFGFSMFEMVFEVGDYEGKPMIMLKKLGYRKPTSIMAWETADKEPGIQQLLSDGKQVSIPLYKLMHIAHEQEGDNYEGTSILRAAYKNWSIKDKLYKIDAVGAENQALGIAKITIPANTGDTEKAAIKEWAISRRASEVGHVIVPNGIEVEMMDMKSSTLKDIKPSIDHHDRQIMKNVLAQFLEIGASSSGNRATSEDHSRLFEMGVTEVANVIIAAVQATVVKTLVELNYTNAEEPKLAVGNISDENIPVISEAISKFTTAGILHARAADENAVRKLVGLPEVEEDDLQEFYDTEDTTSTDTDEPDAVVNPTDDIEDVKALRASVEDVLHGYTARAA